MDLCQSQLNDLTKTTAQLDYWVVQVFSSEYPSFGANKSLTNPRKTDTIRISISYRSVPGKRGPEFIRSADLQSPPHKWHGFRILTHNPEVSGSNPLPATNAREIWRFSIKVTGSIELCYSNPLPATTDLGNQVDFFKWFEYHRGMHPLPATIFQTTRNGGFSYENQAKFDWNS